MFITSIFVTCHNIFISRSDWLNTDFVTTHRDHDTNLTKALKHSAAMSEAAALTSLLREWVRGSPEITSFGVISTGDVMFVDSSNF